MSQAQTNVLVVCHDSEIRALIRAALEDLPVRITKECESGKGVTEAMVQNPAALVIVDLFLPGTNGLEVLKVLKKVNDGAEFILITRLRTRSAIDKAFRYGAQDVLVYPFDTDTLHHTVAHRLELLAKPGTVIQ